MNLKIKKMAILFKKYLSIFLIQKIEYHNYCIFVNSLINANIVFDAKSFTDR